MAPASPATCATGLSVAGHGNDFIAASGQLLAPLPGRTVLALQAAMQAPLRRPARPQSHLEPPASHVGKRPRTLVAPRAAHLGRPTPPPAQWVRQLIRGLHGALQPAPARGDGLAATTGNVSDDVGDGDWLLVPRPLAASADAHAMALFAAELEGAMVHHDAPSQHDPRFCRQYEQDLPRRQLWVQALNGAYAPAFAYGRVDPTVADRLYALAEHDSGRCRQLSFCLAQTSSNALLYTHTKASQPFLFCDGEPAAINIFANTRALTKVGAGSQPGSVACTLQHSWPAGGWAGRMPTQDDPEGRLPLLQKYILTVKFVVCWAMGPAAPRPEVCVLDLRLQVHGPDAA